MQIFAVKEKCSAIVAGSRSQRLHFGYRSPEVQAQQTRIHNIMRSTGAQAKLTIGQPNDQYEQEADRVADRVMAMSDPRLQRQPENEEEEETLRTKPLADQITPLVQRQEESPEEEEEPLQAKFWYGDTVQRMCAACEEEQAQRQLAGEEDEELRAKGQPGRTPQVTTNIESRISNLKGGGQPLDPATRSFFEPRFGRDFSDVRLHTDSAAADTAGSIHARAFTLGNHVVMGSGEYQPGSQSGQRLLGHELTHVIQQASRHQNNYSRPLGSKPDTSHIQRKSNYEENYSGKSFVVQDKKAVLRNEDLSPMFYNKSDEIPEGKKVGDKKVIPHGTEVYVSETKTDSKRNTYAYVWQKGSPLLGIIPTYKPLGWTAVTNFKGKFQNVVTGMAPAKSDLLSVFGLYQTVWDPNSLLREGSPNYNSTGDKIAQGTYVVVVDKSEDTEPEGKYVQIAGVEAGGDGYHIIGWTAAGNLKEGWADIFGPNAAWEEGKYIGQVNLVNIVGTGGETEQITPESYPKYKEAVNDAGKEKVQIGLNSGFRSYPMQTYLYNGYKSKKPGFNKAAIPGHSNHQNGKAFDLNTTGSKGTGWGSVYNWLRDNAWKYGFIRTVKSEHWHWEYRPDKVKKGKHTIWGV